MGKTETGKMFKQLGLPVYDADAAVHQLYEPGGAAVPRIEKAFPGCVVDGRVDRTKLAERVTNDKKAFNALERIVHPLVAQEQASFLEKARAAGHDIVVLDIPLLYETGGDARMDAVVVVSASSDIQRQRVLERPGMTREKLDRILARQLPDPEKRAKADYVVQTDQGLGHAFEQVKTIVRELVERRLIDQRSTRHA